MAASTATISVDAQSRLSCLDIHDHSPLMAVGSLGQFVKLLSTDGNLLSTVRYHDGFLGQRLPPITSVTFHPYRVMMAAGGFDSLVSIFMA